MNRKLIRDQIEFAKQMQIKATKDGDEAAMEAWHGYVQGLQWVLQDVYSKLRNSEIRQQHEQRRKLLETWNNEKIDSFTRMSALHQLNALYQTQDIESQFEYLLGEVEFTSDQIKAMHTLATAINTAFTALLTLYKQNPNCITVRDRETGEVSQESAAEMFENWRQNAKEFFEWMLDCRIEFSESDVIEKVPTTSDNNSSG